MPGLVKTLPSRQRESSCLAFSGALTIVLLDFEGSDTVLSWRGVLRFAPIYFLVEFPDLDIVPPYVATSSKEARPVWAGFGTSRGCFVCLLRVGCKY